MIKILQKKIVLKAEKKMMEENISKTILFPSL